MEKQPRTRLGNVLVTAGTIIASTGMIEVMINQKDTKFQIFVGLLVLVMGLWFKHTKAYSEG